MLLAVAHVLVGDAGHQGVSGVAVRQQGAHGQQHLGDGQRRTPVLLQDVQADGALAVDVAVVDAGLEHHLDNAVDKLLVFNAQPTGTVISRRYTDIKVDSPYGVTGGY